MVTSYGASGPRKVFKIRDLFWVTFIHMATLFANGSLTAQSPDLCAPIDNRFMFVPIGHNCRRVIATSPSLVGRCLIFTDIPDMVVS